MNVGLSAHNVHPFIFREVFQSLLAHAALIRSISMGLGVLANSIDLRTGQSDGVSCIILQCEGENNGMIGSRAGGSDLHSTLWFSLSSAHVLSNSQFSCYFSSVFSSLFPGIYLPVHVLSYFRPPKGVGLMFYFLRQLFHLPAGSQLLAGCSLSLNALRDRRTWVLPRPELRRLKGKRWLRKPAGSSSSSPTAAPVHL